MPEWLLIIIGIVIVVLIVALTWFISKGVTLLQTINGKIDSIEGEIRPMLSDVEQMLRDVEPLVKEIGDRKDEIGNMLANIEGITDDAHAATKAIRDGIIPIIHNVAGVASGLMEGSKAISSHIKAKKENK